jgi:hypothetical protein
MTLQQSLNALAGLLVKQHNDTGNLLSADRNHPEAKDEDCRFQYFKHGKTPQIISSMLVNFDH